MWQRVKFLHGYKELYFTSVRVRVPYLYVYHCSRIIFTNGTKRVPASVTKLTFTIVFVADTHATFIW